MGTFSLPGRRAPFTNPQSVVQSHSSLLPPPPPLPTRNASCNDVRRATRSASAGPSVRFPLRPFVICDFFVKIFLRELSVDSLTRRESAPSRNPLASLLRN